MLAFCLIKTNGYCTLPWLIQGFRCNEGAPQARGQDWADASTVGAAGLRSNPDGKNPQLFTGIDTNSLHKSKRLGHYTGTNRITVLTITTDMGESAMTIDRKRVRTSALTTLLALLFAANLAFGQEGSSTVAKTDPAAMTMDLVLARPGGFVATLAGTAVFVVSLPFSALGGNTQEAWDSLVVTPAVYTFKRPLGNFDYKYPEAKQQDISR